MCTVGRDLSRPRTLERMSGSASNRATNAVHRSFPRVGSRPKSTTSHDERANHSTRGKEVSVNNRGLFSDKLTLARRFLSCFLSLLRFWRHQYHFLARDRRGRLMLEFLM